MLFTNRYYKIREITDPLGMSLSISKNKYESFNRIPVQFVYQFLNQLVKFNIELNIVSHKERIVCDIHK